MPAGMAYIAMAVLSATSFSCKAFISTAADMMIHRLITPL